MTNARRNDDVRKIDQLRIRMLYGQSRIAQAIAAMNLGLAIYVFRKTADPLWLAVWGFAAFAIYGARMALQSFFLRRTSKADAEFDPAFWEKAHVVMTGLSGLLWGSAVIFVLPSSAIFEQTFLAFLLAGTTAGATVAYATSLRATFAFLLPSIIPFAFFLAVTGHEAQQAMALLLVLYLFGLSSAIRRLHVMIVESIRLRFEEGRLLHELKDAQCKLIHSAKMSALGEMAAGIAHEINNPLAIIHFYSTQLMESGLPPEAATIVGKIDKTSGRIAKIVSGLRAFARGDAMDKLQPVALDSLIGETLELCHVRQKKQRILLMTNEIPRGVRVNCRPTQIVQVLLNLLNNAFDAVEQREEPWVGIEVRVAGDHVTISVTDNGPGIAPEHRQRIMQPFFTTKETGKGTGLGLSIAHGIATAHGGKLALDETSKQTRFVLTLPRIVDEVTLEA